MTSFSCLTLLYVQAIGATRALRVGLGHLAHDGAVDDGLDGSRAAARLGEGAQGGAATARRDQVLVHGSATAKR